MSDGTLVTLSMVFPTPDRRAVSAQIAPIVQEAIAAGGYSASVSVQSYEIEDEDLVTLTRVS